MKHQWYYFSAVLFGVITGCNLLLDLGFMQVVVCGLDPGFYIIRDLKQAMTTATFGVIHLWLVYCWAIRNFRSEGTFGFFRTIAIVLLSLIAVASVMRYVVRIVVVCS